MDQNKVLQTEIDVELLTQGESNYSFLRQYHSNFLQSTTIVDLLISLPAKLELNQIIHNLIHSIFNSIRFSRPDKPVLMDTCRL